jgi:hypothetical protein
LVSFRSGSGVLNDAIATGTAAGRGIGGGSDKAALPLAISATETPWSASAVARGASTCSARVVADVARLTWNRRSGTLDAERTEAGEPRPEPTGESARSVQCR